MYSNVRFQYDNKFLLSAFAVVHCVCIDVVLVNYCPPRIDGNARRNETITSGTKPTGDNFKYTEVFGETLAYIISMHICRYRKL